MSFHIAQIGTFDYENFGDLLFPEVLQYNLSNRLDDVKIDLFSPLGGKMPFYPDKYVYPIKELENVHLKTPFDAIIIGGGDIARLDKDVASKSNYDILNASYLLWVYPTIFSSKYGIPVFWNSIGVPFEFEQSSQKIVSALLSKTDYISVRDELSKNILSFYGDTECNVFPDTIMSIARQFKKDDLDNELEIIAKKNDISFSGNYIVFQANYFDDSGSEVLSEIIKYAKSNSLKVILMPIGYVHNDLEYLKMYHGIYKDSCSIISDKLTPKQMIAIISHASFFIGTSLHGNVISYDFDVPFLAFEPKPLTKIDGFLKITGNENRKFSNAEGFIYAANNSKTDFSRQKDIIDSIDRHFDTIAEKTKLKPKKEIISAYELTNFLTALFPSFALPNYCLIYYDFGSGYSETNKVFFNIINRQIDIELKIPDDVKKIRLDPCESACIVYDFKVRSDKSDKDISSTNASVNHNGSFVFFHSDPIFEIELDDDDKVIYISATIDVLNTNLLNNINSIAGQFKQETDYSLISKTNKINELESYCSKLENRNSELKNHNSQLEDHNSQLKNHNSELENRNSELENHNSELNQLLSQTQNTLNIILSSKFWRYTMPIRTALQKLKGAIEKRKNLVAVLIFLKCFLLHGYKAAKIKYRQFKPVGEKQFQSSLSLSEEVLNAQRNYKFKVNTKFSVLVPLYNTPEKLLKEMIESVVKQTYSNWELCLADGSDGKHSYVESVCRKYAKSDSRILYKKLEKNLGIAENTNACAKMASGDYIALFDHDDLLQPNALFENAKAIEEASPDILYSDENKVDENGNYSLPFYKPDWSRDLLYSQMYICHLLVFKKSVFEEIGGYRSDYNGAQDYDLMLRLSEKADKIYHIPKLLYSWRMTETSTASNPNSKPYAQDAGLKALDAHLKRIYGDTAYAQETENMFVYAARFNTLENQPKVSIIMPMKDHCDLSDACIKSVIEKTEYQNYDILILDNNSELEETHKWFETIQNFDKRIKVIPAKFPFNWSRLNNFGIKNSDADVFIFLNNDMEVITPCWMERLCENALRDDIAVVGSQLLYEDGTLQHAGVVVGMGGWADHVFKGMEPVHYSSPFVSPVITRNVLAVTGACMAISRKTIDDIGGFDEEFIICGSDVEICTRAYEKGYRNLYMPYSKLYHYESKSRDSFIPEIDFKKSAIAYDPYRGENHDPYFNKNLDINSCVPKENQ